MAKRGRPRWQDDPNYDPHCRRCGVPLRQSNARMSRGRFVGACRVCESAENRLRWEAKHPGAKVYTDSRRKYEGSL